MAQSEVLGVVNQSPSKLVAGNLSKLNLDNYGNLYTKPVDLLARAQQGSLWVGGNPTAGTGIASHAAPTATDGTKPVCMFKNAYAAGTDKHIYLQQVLLAVTAAGTNATSSRVYVEKSFAGTERFSSGGSTNLNSSALVANPCGTSTFSTSLILRLGAVVATATAAEAKLIGKGLVRSIIPKVNDQIEINFGELAGHSGCTLLDYANTGAALTRLRMPSVDLAPGEQLLIHLVNAGQDAASSYELSATWIEA